MQNPRKLTTAQLYTLNERRTTRANQTNTKLVSPTTPDVFAIVPLNNLSMLQHGDRISISGSDLAFNKRSYFGPVSLEKMSVKLINDKGFVLDLNGADWSFTIISKHIYQL